MPCKPLNLSAVLLTFLFFLEHTPTRAAEEPSVLVTLEPVRRGTLVETLTAYDTVEYSPERAQVVDVQGEGLVTRVHVATGQQVRHGDPLIELVATVNSATELEHANIAAEFARQDYERLRVRLGIEPEDLALIREGQRVHVTALHPGAQKVMGQVLQLYYQIDPKTWLAEAVVPMKFSPDLLPGAMVRGEVILEEHLHVLSISRTAVLGSADKRYVFVADKGNAHRRWIEAGFDDGRRVDIRAGLADGESVVVSGNYELHDGMAIRTDGEP